MNYHKHPRLQRSLLACAGTALLSMHGVTQAEQVNLDLELRCPFPLIGEQPILASISADYPAEVSWTEPFGPFRIDTITVVNDTSRQGLALLQAKTVTGEATSFTLIRTGARDIENNVPLVVDPTPVPEESTSFDVPASGDAPAATFTQDDIGPARITVEDLVLELTNLKEDGTPAGQPVGQFTSDCVVVEGQNNILHQFEITGGAAEQDINVATSELDFGNVQIGLSEEQSFAVSNTGGMALGVNSISLEGDDTSAFIVSNDCTVVGSGDSCSVSVTFAPSSAGSQSATLAVISDDPDEPRVEVSLTGSGQMQPEPDIDVTGEPVSFGTIAPGETSDQTVTIANTGNAGLDISAVELLEGSAFSLLSTDCAIVPANGTCSVSLQFNAATAGSYSDTLQISSNDPDEATSTVTLNGTVQDNSSETIDVEFDVNGSTFVQASGNSLPLTGTIESTLELATGIVSGQINLEPTQGTFQISQLFRKLQATAEVAFEPVSGVDGSLISGTLTATTEAYIKVPSVSTRIFGIKIPLGGGDSCRTIDPVSITVSSPAGEVFQPLNGGRLTGSYSLPALENCGLLTSVLSHFLAGPDNTIDLNLTPGE